MKTIEGQKNIRGQKFGIVVSRFNHFITKRLLSGCLKEFKKRGIKDNDLTVVWVPGSFEISVTALKLAEKKSLSAVVCLGAVIRGETLHFDLIARAAADGIRDVSLKTGKPVVFGVITADTVDQAYRRSDDKGDHKGREAARCAMDMASVFNQLSLKKM